MVARLQAQGYVANVPFLLRASGALDRDILADALQFVVDRHEILRSAFVIAGKTLMQAAPDPFPVHLAFRDLADRESPIAAAQADCAVACRTPFLLDRPCRLVVTVYRLGPDDHLIASVVDHLSADGMSLGILGMEWRSFYQAIEGGAPLQLAPVAPQYRAFAERQRDWLTSSDAEDQRRWWSEYLRGHEPAGSSANEGVRPATSLEFSLAYEVGRAVSRLCTRYKLTPFMVVLAAYAVLLAGLQHHRDVIVATVRANRRDPATAGMVGNLANLVPIRVSVDAASTSREFLPAVGRLCRETYAHDTLPFLEIADAASRRLRMAPAALARYAINFVPFPGEPDIWSPDLRVSQQWGLLEPRPQSTGIASLFVRQQGMRFGGTLIADPAALSRSWIHAFAARLAATIVGLTDPRRSIRDLISAAAD
jgi:hypothetical protein